MDSELHKSWGRKVRERRQAMHLSQDQLADMAEVRQATISRVESGNQCPSDAVKWRLAGALGVTVEQIFPYPAVKPPAPVAS